MALKRRRCDAAYLHPKERQAFSLSFFWVSPPEGRLHPLILHARDGKAAPAPRFCFVRGCGTSRPTGGAFRPPGPPVFFPGPHVPPANPKQSPSFFSENDILTSLVSLIQYLVLHPVGILPGQAERLRALPSWIGGKLICFLRLLRPPPCSGPKLQFLTGWSAGA